MSLRRVLVTASALTALAACGGLSDRATTSVSEADARVEKVSRATAAHELGDRLFTHAQSAGDLTAPLLQQLTQRAPARSAGSRSGEEAINWAEQAMVALGLQGVHREPVIVPCWDRGKPEIAKLFVAGIERPMAVAAMRGSVPTRIGGLRAGLVRVTSVEEFETRKAELADKIVFLDVRLKRGVVSAQDAYGEAAEAIERGASHAATAGARAVVVRSPALADDDSVRVVRVDYLPGVKRIPAVTVSPLVAGALEVACASDPNCEFFLELDCSPKPVLRLTSNVVGEIRGKVHPEEVVLLAARLDGVHVGEAAHSGGASVARCLEAARLLLSSGVELDRTVRVLLHTDGVDPGRGLHIYAADHSDELDLHVVALGSSGGGFRPTGFHCAQAEIGTEMDLGDIRSFASVLDPIGISSCSVGASPSCLGVVLDHGVSTVELRSVDAAYFDLANSHLDRFASVDPRSLGIGSVAIAYAAAAFASPSIYR